MTASPASPGALDTFEYLRPLFDRAASSRGPLPEPATASSVGSDDRPLGSWSGNTLIRSSVGAGVAHVDALMMLITKAGLVDPYSPWTLLRGALENFAVAVWLLTGKDRTERRSRALAMWAEDMRLRGLHETDTDHVITGPKEKSGPARQEDIRQLADSIGTPRATLPRTRMADDILPGAATAAGLDPVALRAIWRVASGFAHGRFWPNLRAAQPREAYQSTGGYLVAIVLDEAKHAQLAAACEGLLGVAVSRYTARAVGT